MKKIHHSLADWDYRVGAKLELATDQFISSPTSLRTQALDAGGQIECIYLGDALGHNIPEGRLTFHLRSSFAFNLTSLQFFRCQDINHTDIPQNCYYINMEPTTLYLIRHQAGIGTILQSAPPDPDLLPNEWVHWQLTWYQYIEADLHKYLRVILKRQIAGLWVERLSWNDELNLWADSAINRIGFRFRAGITDIYQYMDDTEVWEKT